MNYSKFRLVAVILLAFASMSVATSTANLVPAFHPAYIPAHTASGYIVIEQNGTVAGNATSIITRSGYNYTLTGNLTGNITIMRSGANLIGNGFTITNASWGVPTVLVINGSAYVNISRLNIHISNYETLGIAVQYSSYVTINDVNISTNTLALDVGAGCSYINLTNSHLLDNLSEFSVLPGVAAIGLTPLGPVHSTSNVTIYKDTFNVSGNSTSPVGIFSNSNYTEISQSTFNVTNPNVLLINVASNYSMIHGNIIDSNASNAPIATGDFFGLFGPPYASNYRQDNVTNNILYLNDSKSAHYIPGGIIEGASGNISGNTVMIYNGSTPAPLGIALSSSNTTVDGNHVTILNSTELPSAIFAINDVNNVNLSHNTISIPNAQGGATGIGIAGNNYSLYRNSINITSGISGSTGIAEVDLLSNTTISNNFINVSKSGGNSSTQMYGIQLIDNGPTTTITGNTINSAKSNKSIGIFLSQTNNFSISNNRLHLIAGAGEGIYTPGTFNYTVSGNSVDGNANTNMSGIATIKSENGTFTSNTVNHFLTALKVASSGNMSFQGNWFQNSSSVAINLTSDYYLQFYHNNFVNYASPANITAGGNLSFNSTYPVGGNYWSSNTGADKFSGPGQNITGPDGISDTPFSLNSSTGDYYPLVSPWTNPMAIFTQSGLPSGTQWSVTFNGQTQTTTGSTITFAIVNGTFQPYTYTIKAISGYSTLTKNGIFEFQGSGFSLPVGYAKLHNLTVHESGLPSGSSWTFLLNGTKYSTTNSSYELKGITSCSLSYAIDNTTLFYSSVYAGMVSLAAANGYLNVTFVHFAYITGEVTPSNATVLVNGRSITVHNGGFNLSVAAGSYKVEITLPGYSPYYDNFTLASNHTENLSANLVKLSTGGKSGLPINDYVYIAAGATVVIIAGVVVYLWRKP